MLDLVESDDGTARGHVLNISSPTFTDVKFSSYGGEPIWHRAQSSPSTKCSRSNRVCCVPMTRMLLGLHSPNLYAGGTQKSNSVGEFIIHPFSRRELRVKPLLNWELEFECMPILSSFGAFDSDDNDGAEIIF